MKSQTLIFVGVLSLTSCTNESSPFVIDRFFPLGACVAGGEKDLFKLAESNVVTNGYLDVAAGSPQYTVGVALTGADRITQTPLTLGTTNLEMADRNKPIINLQFITYRLSKRVGATPKPYLSNRTIPFSKEGKAFATIQLISPDLGAQLFDGLTPSNAIDDFVDLLVDVEFKGEYSNSRTPFTTGIATFPIRAFRSAPTTVCTNGFVRYAVDNGTGELDVCSYVGQAYEQVVTPSQPSSCCAPAGSPVTPGC